MKKILIIFLFGLFFLAPADVFAEDETVLIKLKIQALDQVLFDGDFDVEECEKTPGSGQKSFNAWCAVRQLADQQGWALSESWGAFGVFLNSLAGYAGDAANNLWWLWYSEMEPGATSLNEHVLASGEDLLLAYGASPLKISASDQSPQINSTTTISSFYFDSNAWQWTATSTTLLVNGQNFEAAGGTHGLFTSTTSPYKISAQKTGFVSSKEITVSPQLPKRKIDLRIETATSTVFDQEIEFSACESVFGSGTYNFNGYCAVDQFAPQVSWSWWGQDAFLDSIGGFGNNAGGNGVYWLWFDNLEYGQSSLNKSALNEGDDLLLVYGIDPLQISVATTTPEVGGTLEIKIQEFGFDAAWNPAWLDASSSTLSVNGQDIFLADGTYHLTVSTTSPYSINASKDGFLKASAMIILPREAAAVLPDDEEEAGGSSGGGGGVPEAVAVFDLEKGARFLAQNQVSDGSFGADLYTDWTAVALAAVSSYQGEKTKLKNFLLNDNFSSGVFMDYQRRAMALMSLGISPYNGTNFDYIKKIADSFDGSQLGDASYFNDDIFGIIILLNAGYSKSDIKIAGSLDHVLSFQDSAGSFSGVDLTAAAIQMLSLFSGNVQAEAAKTKALAWLSAQQGDDGGYGNSYATSWTAQAVASSGGNVYAWQKNGKNPLNYLGAFQVADGGLESGLGVNNRVWATAYALAAASGRSWDSILENFSAPELPQFFPGRGDQAENATSTQEVEIEVEVDAEVSTSTPENNEEIEEIQIMPEDKEPEKVVLNDETPEKPVPSLLSVKAGVSKEAFVRNVSSSASAMETDSEKVKISLSASVGQKAKSLWLISGAGVLLFGIYLGGKIWVLLFKL